MVSRNEARNIRALRIAAGLSQAELADKAGIERTRVSRYECGYKYIPPSDLAKLAAALGVTADELTRVHTQGYRYKKKVWRREDES